jgi:hypothetical protein
MTNPSLNDIQGESLSVSPGANDDSGGSQGLCCAAQRLPQFLLGLLGCLMLWPVNASAQSSNFGDLTLNGGFVEADAEGFTAGVYSLSNIVSRDRNGTLCLGYADTTPDHLLILQQDFSQLTITLDSNGADTTLLIQGPNDNTVRCNDNADRRSRDAGITDSFQAGTYRLWVGAFNQGESRDYVLSIRE